MSQKEPLRCIVFTKPARPPRRLGRRISRKKTAATGDQQIRGALPLAQQFCDAVECESFANGAEIELQLAAQTKNGLFIRQQTPLRKRELTCQGRWSRGKCAVCRPFHPFRDLQAGKSRFAQAHLL